MSLGWGKHSIPHNQSVENEQNISDAKTESVKNQWVETK
jgi:hypothetical protein